jgi:hypothetical protein
VTVGDNIPPMLGAIEALAATVRRSHDRTGRIADADAVAELRYAAEHLRRAERRLEQMRAEEAVALAKTQASKPHRRLFG